MPIVVESHRASLESIERRHPGARVIDVTSRGPEPWARFSPFYPHGNIPVPFTNGVRGKSVEGIWQGLKVFERADVDVSKFENARMKGLKRSSRSFGRVLGHRAGITGDRLLPYLEARRQIYVPTYEWTLREPLREFVGELRRMSKTGCVVLLDYETNADIDDPRRPLSHAALVKAFVEREAV
jgi:hypothetical protein